MLRDYINTGEFRISGEIPLLMSLRLRQLLRKKSADKKRILIVDTCIIGDFIATLPALRQFIQSTDAPVDVVVSPPLKSIAASIKGVQRVFTARSIYARSIEKHAEQVPLPDEYDHVLVMRISPDAYRLLSRIRYSRITTYEIPLLKYFAHLLWNISLKREVRQWREVNFEMVGLKEPDRIVEFDEIFSISENEYGQLRDIPELNGSAKRIIIHTGSGWSVKLWDDERWVETIRKINKLGKFNFIFIGSGDHETNSFEYIRDRLDFKVHSLINKVDLKTTLLIMRLSSYFIGIDSGPRNMAHLADLRSVTLLGPAPHNFQSTNKSDVVIDKFTCRCKSLFYMHRVSAIHKITADEVFDGFRGLLERQ
jgi:ADP-heptose:LPS heptosyltransferase